MTSVYPPSVTVVQVGNFFVGQYYQVLQKNPDFVHQFYNDSSSFTLIDGPVVNTATAILQIHSLIMSLNFKTIEIKTAHSMESLNGGVLVVVSGSVKSRDVHVKRRFIQTFFLAPQEKGYYILNDIFQFIDEEPIEEHQPKVIEHGHYNSDLNTLNQVPEPEVVDYRLEREIHSDNFVPEVHVKETEVVEMHSNEVDNYSIPQSQQPISEMNNTLEEQIQAEEPSILYRGSVSIGQDSTSLVAEDPIEDPNPIKHTYASILRASKAHSRPYVPPQSSANVIPVASGWDDIPQPPPVQSYPVQSTVLEKPSAETVEYPSLDDEGEVTSVYVRNLPSSASASELEQEFKNFGKIKPDGVLIKSKKEVGVYYAFVEFENISGVHNAVQASPIAFDGRKIYVEERRPNADSSRGRRGRGRSGYQSESTRGRFGNRSFGRGNWQDNAASMEYGGGRSRGNGYVQRGYRQERGILGRASEE